MSSFLLQGSALSSAARIRFCPAVLASNSSITVLKCGTSAVMSRGIQASSDELPHAVNTMPTGTPACSCKNTEKAAATALSGVCVSHTPAQKSCSVKATVRGTMKLRICDASFTKSATFGTERTPICMFDCPEQIQTSPTTTSASRTGSGEADDVTVITRGWVLATKGSRSTRHRPWSPACVCLSWPANDTATVAPGSAVPHTGTGIARCSTMCSPNGEPSRSSATAGSTTAPKAATKTT